MRQARQSRNHEGGRTSVTSDDLEQLVQKHGRGWRLLAAQWANDPDDCVQEAILRLIRQTTPPSQPAAWVFRVVRNLATNQKRRADLQARHAERLAASRSIWEDIDPTTGLQADELQTAMNELNDDERTAVVSKIWGELTFAEIGICLQCSTATAHRLYQSALKQLAQRLESDTSRVS